MATDEQIDIATLLMIGYKALYLILFIGLMIPMMAQAWAFPPTIPFIGALISLTFPLLTSRKELFEPWDFSYLTDEREFEPNQE